MYCTVHIITAKKQCENSWVGESEKQREIEGLKTLRLTDRTFERRKELSRGMEQSGDVEKQMAIKIAERSVREADRKAVEEKCDEIFRERVLASQLKA